MSVRLLSHAAGCEIKLYMIFCPNENVLIVYVVDEPKLWPTVVAFVTQTEKITSDVPHSTFSSYFPLGVYLFPHSLPFQ